MINTSATKAAVEPRSSAAKDLNQWMEENSANDDSDMGGNNAD